MSKKSKRLRTTAARSLRAGRHQTGELRDRLMEIAGSYKKRAHQEEVQTGERPRSKKRTAKKK
jgi:hypothetical protein